ncbi:MAG: hypothetical protein LCH98_18920 [Actinobacteria bacterium]|nr:hypothetical protein [Actinomycetota bacterium]
MNTDLTRGLERELRAAYDATAALHIREPGPLPSIPRRPRWVAPAASVAAVAVLVGGVYAVSRGGDPPTAPAATATTPATPSPTPTSPGARRSTARDTPVPGGERIELVGPLVVREGTGTVTIDLGPRPAGANAIAHDLSCLTAGSWDAGPFGTTSCDGPGPEWTEPTPLNASEQAAAQQVFTVTGTGQVRVRMGWAKRSVQPLATNARGESYGSMANGLAPDLVLVAMKNGGSGYVRRTDLEPTEPRNTPGPPITTNPAPRTIPVYESDGVAVIGEFGIGGGTVVPPAEPSWSSPGVAPSPPAMPAPPSPAASATTSPPR